MSKSPNKDQKLSPEQISLLEREKKFLPLIQFCRKKKLVEKQTVLMQDRITYFRSSIFGQNLQYAL
jgi:hypothetical protein